MKTYRLIKSYPGSPSFGTILTPKIDKDIDDTDNFYWKGIWFNPKNFPNNWEEVVKKNYEILEIALFRCDKTFITSTIGNSDEYNLSLLNCSDNRIRKVKRLSDGEVFAIGDKIECISIYKDLKLTLYNRIRNIKILGSEIILHTGNGWLGGICMSNAKHKKQPLFITEDGVDIFEGDEVYYVETDDEPENSFKVNTYKVLKYPGRFTSDNTLHSFSTKEKAEEYILMNKPCLSVNDILSISSCQDRRERELKKLAYNNLNK